MSTKLLTLSNVLSLQHHFILPQQFKCKELQTPRLATSLLRHPHYSAQHPRQSKTPRQESYTHRQNPRAGSVVLVFCFCVFSNNNQTQISSKGVTVPTVLYSPVLIENATGLHHTDLALLYLSPCDNLPTSDFNPQINS